MGGLPEDLGFELVEPLRDLFKDEVRKLGEVLGFQIRSFGDILPGPGLAVRIIGDITKERLDLLRECDEILLEEIVSGICIERPVRSRAASHPIGGGHG